MELRDFYREEIVLLVADSLLDQIYGEKKEQVLRTVDETGDLRILKDCPFVLNNQTDIAGRIGRQLMAQSDFVPQVRAESNNIETLLDICLRGGGACFCPENLVSTTLSPDEIGRLHILRFGEQTRYMIRFGYRKQAHQWSMLQNFVNMAIETMG